MIFVPFNVSKTHWKVMVIVNTLDEVKETEVMFLTPSYETLTHERIIMLPAIRGK